MTGARVTRVLSAGRVVASELDVFFMIDLNFEELEYFTYFVEQRQPKQDIKTSRG